MNIRMKKLSLALVQTFSAGVIVAATTAAHAQTPQKVEKIEVTGSNIKRIDAEGVAPVQILSKEDIEKSGKSTVAELLRSISSNSAGSYSEVFSNSFSPGASGASLRGLGQKATLVLLNGRRMANYGFAQNLQDTYVDLNSIPSAAVERIEVLKDGASAVYGSDAIGGVINIILRKDYSGAELNVSAGTSSEGGLDEFRFTAAGGMGDIAKDRYNVLATFDYFKRDLLLMSEREFTKDQDFRRFPGGNFDWASGATYRTSPRQPFSSCGKYNPGVETPGSLLATSGTVCAYNIAPYLTLFPETERMAFLSRGTIEFSPTLSGFGEIMYSHNKSFQNFTPAAVSPTSVAFDPVTGGVRIINGTLPANNPSNIPGKATATGINYTFFDVGPRSSDIDSKSYRGLIGLKGTMGNWDWEAGLGSAKNEVNQINNNRVDAFVLSSAIANGTYNFLNPDAGTIKAADLRINPTRQSTSKLDFVDFKVSSEIGQLPAGPLGFAAGIEYRKESIHDRPDALLTTGHVLGQGATGTDGDRNSTAVFAELSIPATKNLEFQLAGRQDRYSDFGSAFSPKAGFRWTPDKSLIVRGTVSRGFRAPTLPENAKSSSTFFVGVVDTFEGSPNFNRAVTIAGVFAGNPDLKAEKSNNYNLGFVFEPRDDFNVGAAWFKIRQNNIVSSNGFQYIVDNPTFFPGQILRGADGTLIAISDKFRNLLFVETSGVDFDFRKIFKTDGWGKFTVSGDWTYISHYKSVPALDADVVDYVDSNEFGTSIPRYKGNLKLNWEKNNFSTTLTYLYTHSFDQTGVAVPPAQARVGSYAQYDISASYDGFKNLKLYGSIQNLLDTDPPFDPSNSNRYDFTQNDLRGRYYTVGMKYTFK